MSGINRPPTKWTKDTPWMDDSEWQQANRIYHSTVDLLARNSAMEQMQRVEQEYMRGERVSRSSFITPVPASELIENVQTPDTTLSVAFASHNDIAIIIDALTDYAELQRAMMFGDTMLPYNQYCAVWSNDAACKRMIASLDKVLDKRNADT